MMLPEWFPDAGQCYLLYAFFLNYFRVVAYTLFPVASTKGKMSEDGWRSLYVREVTFAYTRFIRLFMIFRGTLCLWALFLADSVHKRIFISITVLTDAYFWAALAKKSLPNSVMKHRNQAVPITVQGLVFLVGVYFHVHWLGLGGGPEVSFHSIGLSPLWENRLENYYLLLACTSFAHRFVRGFWFIRESVVARITAEGLLNPGVREVSRRNIRIEGFFMLYRLSLCLWAFYLPRTSPLLFLPSPQRTFCFIMFIFDVYWLYRLMTYGTGKKSYVMKQKNKVPDMVENGVLTLAGAFCVVTWLVKSPL